MAGSKLDPLTNEEVEAHALRWPLSTQLAECAAELGLARQQLRVLDWGCGKGTTVARLLSLGYDAYGVDVDPNPIRSGAAWLAAHGYSPEERMQVIGADCRTPFLSGSFHLVVSDQVFEHVRDLEAVATEFARVTRTGGRGVHIFPAKWRVDEPHLHLPFLHWLPKNSLRYVYLRVMAARMSAFRGLSGRPPREKAAAYFDYSTQKTYYRPLKEIEAVLHRHGMQTRIHAEGHPRRWLKACLPFLALSTSLSRSFWRWYTNTFHEVILTTTRESD